MVTGAPLSGTSRRRIRVLLVRQALENLAADLLSAAEGGVAPQRAHAFVRSRLLLLADGAHGDEWLGLTDLARRAGTVYRETSDVLHSNRAFGDVPKALVKEWEEVVATLRAAVAEKLGSTSPGGTAP